MSVSYTYIYISPKGLKLQVVKIYKHLLISTLDSQLQLSLTACCECRYIRLIKRVIFINIHCLQRCMSLGARGAVIPPATEIICFFRTKCPWFGQWHIEKTLENNAVGLIFNYTLAFTLCNIFEQESQPPTPNSESEVKPYKPDWLILPELIPVSVAWSG